MISVGKHRVAWGGLLLGDGHQLGDSWELGLERTRAFLWGPTS